jgi:hypothetical protein
MSNPTIPLIQIFMSESLKTDALILNHYLAKLDFVEDIKEKISGLTNSKITIREKVQYHGPDITEIPFNHYVLDLDYNQIYLFQEIELYTKYFRFDPSDSNNGFSEIRDFTSYDGVYFLSASIPEQFRHISHNDENSDEECIKWLINLQLTAEELLGVKILAERLRSKN